MLTLPSSLRVFAKTGPSDRYAKLCGDGNYAESANPGTVQARFESRRSDRMMATDSA